MNPLLPFQHFVPDAEARVWADGRLYLYGSCDVSGDTYWCSYHLRTFSTTDLLNWTDHGVIFRSDGPGRDNHFATEDLALWAPDCVYHEGRYHLFFCCSDKTEGRASGPSPKGPFTGATPVLGAHHDGIDPAVLVDDDGQVYLYWGQHHCRGAKLNADLTAIVPETLVPSLINEKEHGFHEGASVRKRGGIYYLVYTDISRGKATCMSYATSRSPLGPFTKGGVIIDNDGCDRDTWNNHGSIAEFKGRWYVFYHRSSQGSKYSRRACAEPITFSDDGRIAEVEMTTQGPEGPLPATRPLDAARACRLSGNLRTESIGPAPDGTFTEHLAYIEPGNWAEYKYLDFTPPSSPSSTGPTRFVCRAASLTLGGSIEIRTGSPDGPLIGTCQVSPTGGWQSWAEFSCLLTTPISGVHALYLVFRGPEGRPLNLKTFHFA